MFSRTAIGGAAVASLWLRLRGSVHLSHRALKPRSATRMIPASTAPLPMSPSSDVFGASASMAEKADIRATPTTSAIHAVRNLIGRLSSMFFLPSSIKRREHAKITQLENGDSCCIRANSLIASRVPKLCSDTQLLLGEWDRTMAYLRVFQVHCRIARIDNAICTTLVELRSIFVEPVFKRSRW